jgi:hypothetical protein
MTDHTRGNTMTDMINQVDDAITVAAWHLGIDADTGYTDGYERELAAEIYETIPEGDRGEILAWLVGNAVSGITVGAINMLDETDEGTYALNADLTARLYAQVVTQGRAEQTLLHLIAHEIIEREDTARVLGSRAS